MVREISTKVFGEKIYQLCCEANFTLPADVKEELASWHQRVSGVAAEALGIALENADIAGKERLPLCQDTGMVVIFLEIGQDVHFVGDFLIDAINDAVRKAYTENYFRSSVVEDPLRRINTGDNTPAIVHIELVPGSEVKIILMPKGFGSENKTALKMLNPADGRVGLENFILETIVKAGADPCPPIVVGVGMGGTSEKSTLLAKKALVRKIGESNPKEDIAKLEKELLIAVNNLSIGPQGVGGAPTALSVAVEAYPTHIAGFPVCVCLNCHVARHMEVTI